MNSNFDEALFKERTRDMVGFIKERGSELPLTLAYEAAARFFFDAKSWNNLQGTIKRGPVAPTIPVPTWVLEAAPQTRKLMWRLLIGGDEVDAEAIVRATLSADKGEVLVQFSVLEAFHALSDQDIKKQAQVKWRNRNFIMREAAQHSAWDPEVASLLNYADYRSQAKLEGWVERRDALRYVRAFRPHLLGQVLILEKFVSFAKAAKAGFSVVQVGENWKAISANEQLYPETSDSDFFETEAEAWEALTWDLLEQEDDFKLASIYGVLHNSGKQA